MGYVGRRGRSFPVGPNDRALRVVEVSAAWDSELWDGDEGFLGVISRVTVIISHIRGPTFLTTHEPASVV